MSQEAQRAVQIIDEMPREEFHHNILRKVGKLIEFSTIVCGGVWNASPEQKDVVRKALAENGVPLALTESDEALDEVAGAIASRSVALR